MSNGLLQLMYNTKEAEAEFRRVMLGIPEDIEHYIVGGAVRNSLIREFHSQDLTQRDYDQVITKGTKQYEKYLESLGFKENPYPSHQDVQTVYNKILVSSEPNWDYNDYIVFDMHTMDGTDIAYNIEKFVAFTINGCAIKGQDVLTRPWESALIEVLPGAIQDIKDKKLRLNLDGYSEMSSNFYAMLRFISVGFSAPSPEEVQMLLKELPNLEHARFERNVKKIWDYVGGEGRARELVSSLGIDIDVFNEEVVKAKL
ncbi:MAG: hypothetical protein WC498_04290 [Candidatus Saccharimonadales bacterium]